MENNTFLVDSEFDSVCSEYSEKIEKAETELKNYIEKINAVISEKALEGQHADALQGFSEVVVQTVQDRLQDIGTQYKVLTSSFVENTSTQDDVSW